MTDFNVNGIGMTSERTRRRLVSRLKEQGIRDQRVLNAIETAPRHVFVDEAIAHRAYEDTALPIGLGQTISQPYIVAKMTEAIIDQPHLGNVLEVGTGCGYQTFVLAKLFDRIATIERIKTLHQRARDTLQSLKVYNIDYKYGDGYQGWAQHAPYDAIIVTAAVKDIPTDLLAQLKDGGRMVVPVGDQSVQELQLLIRQGHECHMVVLERVRFVPLIGGQLS